MKIFNSKEHNIAKVLPLGSGGRIEFFNYVPELKQITTLEAEFQKALEELTEYRDHVHKLGVYISRKFDRKVMQEADAYTCVPEPGEIWINPQASLMMSFLYQGVQAVVVFYEDLLKSDTVDLRRTIRHELAHAICGHESGDFKSPGYFDKLHKEAADQLRDRLINLQHDYEVDCFLARRFPKLTLRYIHKYSKELSEKKIGDLVRRKIPRWAHRLEWAMCLIEFYRNLLVLDCVSEVFHNDKNLKRAKKNFKRLFKFAGSRLAQEINKSRLPPVTCDDFKDQYRLRLRFCKMVELDTKQPPPFARRSHSIS